MKAIQAPVCVPENLYIVLHVLDSCMHVISNIFMSNFENHKWKYDYEPRSKSVS